MATPSFGTSLTATVGSTVSARDAVIEQVTYNVYSDPCAYLLSSLASQVRTDIGVPSSAALVCALVSSSVLSDGRRVYRWNVTATWTE